MNVEALRRDTPGTEHRVHLNNAGASLMPRPVLAAVRSHLDLEARIGGYEAAAERREQIDAVYDTLAELVDCRPGNIAITENATASFVLALSSILFQRGDVLVTTRNDYVSNQIQYLALAERLGIEVVRAPDTTAGGVDVHALAEIVHRRRPRLVAVSHVPTSSGLVQDVASVARICRSEGVWCLVDACQSVGQMPVDTTSIPCDFLSATARKFLRGPRGVGFLYVSDRALEAGLTPLYPDLRGADWIDDDLFQPAPDAMRFENWEFAYALVLGLGTAARYALDLGLGSIGARTRALSNRLRSLLADLEGVRVLDRGSELCAIITVHLEGRSSKELMDALRVRGINTTAMDLSSGLLDFRDKGVEGALRISPHYFNTDEELDELVEALTDLL